MSSIAPATTEAELERLLERLEVLRQEIAKVIVGQDRAIEELLVTFLAGGHGLLEGVPGLAKTLMIRTLADAVDLKFRRIQFTNDILPSDIVGVSIYNQKEGTFHFNKGPIFANLVLADEINRSSPRTQSALLQAMEEHQVTLDGTDHELPDPFLVIATQNPLEHHGTYPLPESQMDRFLMRVSMGYPQREAEKAMIIWSIEFSLN